MNERIGNLLRQMNALEDELRTALHEQESRVFFQIHGKRIEFENSVRNAHRRMRTNLLRWFATSRQQNLLSAPFIYSMIVPFVILDAFVTVYQAMCFPLYRIRKVARTDYIIFDRQHLEYLNVMERFNCTYCAYANGLVGYVREIAARTEQYWCPIKHARKMLGMHSRYAQFLDYGEAENYQEGLENLRSALAREINEAADAVPNHKDGSST